MVHGTNICLVWIMQWHKCDDGFVLGSGPIITIHVFRSVASSFLKVLDVVGVLQNLVQCGT